MSKFFQNLVLHDYQVKQFYHALRTKGFVIIAGLSGTGKTKIFEEFCLEKCLDDNCKKSINILRNKIESVIEEADLKSCLDSWAEFIILIKSTVKNESKPNEYQYLSDFIRKSIEKYGITEKDFCLHRIREKGQDNVVWKQRENIGAKDNEISDQEAMNYLKDHIKPILEQIKKGKDKIDYLKAFSDKVYKLVSFLYERNAEYLFDIYKNCDIEKNTEKKCERKLFFPIRPDFKDSKSLLGYYNPLNGKYHKTELLDFIIEAQKEYLRNGCFSAPYLVLFDEMNLARVEYYFADFLSVLESKRVSTIEEVKNNEDMKKNILNSRNQQELEDEQENDLIKLIGFYSKPIILHNEESINDVPQKLYLPPNLYFIGSVNIDETTHTFSPKVLDRAFTIEFDADIGNYIKELKNTPSEKKYFCFFDFIRYGNFAKIEKNIICELIDENKHEDYKKYIEYLEKINSILKPYGLHFGYRVFDEILIFMYNATKFTIDDYKMPMDEAFDLAILMKVLPKFYGTRQRLEKPVMELIKFCELRPVNSQQQNNQSQDQSQNQTNQRQSQQEETDFITPECVPTLEIKNNSKRLKIKDKEYEAIFPHTAKKLIEILYKLNTQGSASFM